MQKLRVFVASPSDMAAERASVETLLLHSRPLADSQGIVLEVIDWSSVVPDMGRPEQVILTKSSQLHGICLLVFCGIASVLQQAGKTQLQSRNIYQAQRKNSKQPIGCGRIMDRPRIMMYRCKRNIPPRRS